MVWAVRGSLGHETWCRGAPAGARGGSPPRPAGRGATLSLSASARASTSVPLPAVIGTMNLTGRFG